MNSVERNKSKLRDERGFITLDFIFALVLSVSVSMVFFAVAITLSLVEAAQYVTYATSRAYMGAHENKALQEELGRNKFAELMALPAFKTFLGKEWFKVGPPQLSDFSEDYGETPNDDNNVFAGARVPIDAVILHLRVPFLGSTVEDSGVGKATLNSYLMREVTTEECRELFNRQRFTKIKELPVNSGAAYQAAPGDKEKLVTDNGC